MKRTGVVSPLGLLLALILYIAVNTLLNVSAPAVRLDVTEDGLYTLSAGTLATLANIDEPIELHFFLSERLGREVPFYASYGRRVRELLNEMSVAAAGKIILREYNPEPFSDPEDHAVSLGVQGIPLDKGAELAYFGLAGNNAVDEQALIPFFQPERETLLEYDLAQMIHSLSNPEPTVVGIMSSLPVMGDVQAQMQGGVRVPWAIVRQLRDHFKLINLPETLERIPADIKVMMLVHPRKLSERAVYELEQFLFRGGRALVFIDPKAEADMAAGPNSTSGSTAGLQGLLQAWGISVPANRLVGDRSMALRINAGTASQPVPAEYLVWLGVTPEYMTQDDPVTSQLPALNIATAGYIQRASDSPLAMEPLISSSRNSQLIAAGDVLGLRPDILGLLDKFVADDQDYVLAARLSGQVSTAFPDGPPARTLVKDTPDTPPLKMSAAPVNLILVADVDVLDERFWLRKQSFFGREVEEKIAGNADFVLNALGHLGGGDELLQLRSRGVSQRKFETIVALEQAAQRRYQDKERELQEKLRETQAKIAGLQGSTGPGDSAKKGASGQWVLSPEQRSTLETLRAEMRAIRKQLRGVQASLREEIKVLESWLKFVNIGLVPLLVFACALGLWGLKMIRRRPRYSGRPVRGAS